MKRKFTGHINPHIGLVYIEAGYFGGMYMEGDALVEASLCQNIHAGREHYFVLFNLRIWRLVLSVSVDFKKEVER